MAGLRILQGVQEQHQAVGGISLRHGGVLGVHIRGVVGGLVGGGVLRRLLRRQLRGIDADGTDLGGESFPLFQHIGIGAKNHLGLALCLPLAVDLEAVHADAVAAVGGYCAAVYAVGIPMALPVHPEG